MSESRCDTQSIFSLIKKIHLFQIRVLCQEFGRQLSQVLRFGVFQIDKENDSVEFSV